jgi:ribose/xylose/arabinose/galactoside ABC-type transport system permease subunit
MLVLFSTLSSEFLSIQNLLDLTESLCRNRDALGLFVVLVTGGIDISFAAVASVAVFYCLTVAQRCDCQPTAVHRAGDCLRCGLRAD